jgi:hypothetical protein
MEYYSFSLLRSYLLTLQIHFFILLRYETRGIPVLDILITITFMPRYSKPIKSTRISQADSQQLR